MQDLFDPQIAKGALQRGRLSATLKRYTLEGLFDPRTGNVMLNKQLLEELERFRKSNPGSSDPWDAIILDERAFRAHLIFAHEQVHWYQNIGTPYGQLTLGLDSALLRQMVTTCAKIRDEWPSVTIKKPLFGFASENLTKYVSGVLSDADRYLIDQTLVAISGQLVWDYLEGNKVVLTSEASDVMTSYASIYNDTDYCISFWEDVSSIESKRKISSSPLGLDGGSIGGLTLLEGQARAIEDIHKILARLNGQLKDVALFEKSRWFGEYARAFDYFISRKGLTRDSELKDMEWLNILIKFCAFCDIALFTPIDPAYRSLWKDSMDWLDFHPGWRFSKLVEVLEPQLDKSIPEWGLYCEQVYSQISDTACGAFGWPKISEFLSIKRSKNPKMTHIQVIDEAMNVRQLFPSAFIAFGCLTAAPTEAYQLLESTCSPPLLFSINGGFEGGIGQYTSNTFEEKSVFSYASLMFDISLQLMFEKGPFHAKGFSGNLSLFTESQKREMLEGILTKDFFQNGPIVEVLK